MQELKSLHLMNQLPDHNSTRDKERFRLNPYKGVPNCGMEFIRFRNTREKKERTFTRTLGKRPEIPCAKFLKLGPIKGWALTSNNPGSTGPFPSGMNPILPLKKNYRVPSFLGLELRKGKPPNLS